MVAHPTFQSTHHLFSTYHQPILLLSCPAILWGHKDFCLMKLATQTLFRIQLFWLDISCTAYTRDMWVKFMSSPCDNYQTSTYHRSKLFCSCHLIFTACSSKQKREVWDFDGVVIWLIPHAKAPIMFSVLTISQIFCSAVLGLFLERSCQIGELLSQATTGFSHPKARTFYFWWNWPHKRFSVSSYSGRIFFVQLIQEICEWNFMSSHCDNYQTSTYHRSKLFCSCHLIFTACSSKQKRER
jgi:hypothetical protein